MKQRCSTMFVQHPNFPGRWTGKSDPIHGTPKGHGPNPARLYLVHDVRMDTASRPDKILIFPAQEESHTGVRICVKTMYSDPLSIDI